MSPDPDPESLRTLSIADVRHIAQMKERQWSMLKWVVAIFVSYMGLIVSELEPPERILALASISLIVISLLAALIIISTQLSMREKRSRLWRVYDALHLSEIVEGKIVGGGKMIKRERHLRLFYNWHVWIPFVLVCLFSAFIGYIIGKPYFPKLWTYLTSLFMT